MGKECWKLEFLLALVLTGYILGTLKHSSHCTAVRQDTGWGESQGKGVWKEEKVKIQMTRDKAAITKGSSSTVDE